MPQMMVVGGEGVTFFRARCDPMRPRTGSRRRAPTSVRHDAGRILASRPWWRSDLRAWVCASVGGSRRRVSVARRRLAGPWVIEHLIGNLGKLRMQRRHASR